MVQERIYTLVVPRFEDIFHSYFAQEVIKGASMAASRLRADLLIHITERESHQDWLQTVGMQPGCSSGILFADINKDRKGLDRVLSRRIPCVVLNNSFSDPIDYINVDNYKATRRVIRYLVELGHRRIATICGDFTTEAAQARLHGYRDGLIAEGLPVYDSYITEGEFLRTPARKAAQKLLSLKKRPTAIFAASDVMALEVLDVAKQLKIAVPKKLSVVGFDDNPIITYSPVPLTTVSQPLAEMARLGMETLHRIGRGKERQPVQKTLTARLIKRESSGAPADTKY